MKPVHRIESLAAIFRPYSSVNLNTVHVKQGNIKHEQVAEGREGGDGLRYLSQSCTIRLLGAFVLS